MSEAQQAESGDDFGGCNNCDQHESEMFVVKDLNLDYAFKGGNMYCRYCPNCRQRIFCAKSYWDKQDVKYVIEQGEEVPRPQYICPYTEEVIEEGEACGEEFLGTPFDEGDDSNPGECPKCERELVWEG